MINYKKRNLKDILDDTQNLISFKKINNILVEIEDDYNKNFNKNSFKLIKHTPINKIDNIKNINISKKINNIQDLIDLVNKNPFNKNIKYNINLEILSKIKEDLIQLNNMIGLKDLKINIIYQILYYIQNLHNFDNNSDYMHIVLYGPPGTGKTEIAKLIGNIFSKLNILKKDKFKKVTRADLVAGYLGQTALKTNKIIEDSLDGVLFIDEAYSLGNSEKRDSFSKECLDTLCEGLSNYKNRLMVIIAGYKEELNQCFFSYNLGLESRFIWKYEIDNYSADELMNIFIKKINDINWKLKIDLINIRDWFKKHHKKFKYYGRSIEILITKTKIAHSKRIFSLCEEYKKIITLEDLDEGLKLMNLDKKEINNDNIYSIYR